MSSQTLILYLLLFSVLLNSFLLFEINKVEIKTIDRCNKVIEEIQVRKGVSKIPILNLNITGVELND